MLTYCSHSPAGVASMATYTHEISFILKYKLILWCLSVLFIHGPYLKQPQPLCIIVLSMSSLPLIFCHGLQLPCMHSLKLASLWLFHTDACVLAELLENVQFIEALI